MPFSLTDSELAVLMRLAEPIAPRLRARFLETVAAELQQLQQQAAHGAHGDGAAHRVARIIQRRFLNASVPLPARRSAPAMRSEPRGVTSKYR
jgi:hypothetical protein